MSQGGAVVGRSKSKGRAMSIEVLLIPIGIAAYAAWKEHQRTDLCEKCKPTRIKDGNLLVSALETIGASNFSFDSVQLTADWNGSHLTFQKVGDIFLGRVDNASEAATTAMLQSLDSALGQVVQLQNLQLVRERATEMGLTLVGEEVQDDGSVELIFEEA
jgi:hypothetical protein